MGEREKKSELSLINRNLGKTEGGREKRASLKLHCDKYNIRRYQQSKENSARYFEGIQFSRAQTQ